MKRFIVLSLAIIVPTAIALAKSRDRKKSEQKPAVVPSVDLTRYQGKWYEIARFPNRFEKSCASEVSATYTLNADNTIRVVNECRKADGQMKRAEGKARKADKDGPTSQLEVRFAPAFLSLLPVVWGDYWVLDLAPDYSYSVVGDESRDYLWILSRTPVMDEVKYQQAVNAAATQGFDVSRLMKTKQNESTALLLR
ncbi:MAG: lipocalin family protein [Blastocatellia bacterium]